MREIKFRRYNSEKKVMVYSNEDDSSNYWDGVCLSDVDLINSRLKYEKDNWMQYTGLKDKNGKEIYEGDIIKQEYKTETSNYFNNLVRYYKVVYIAPSFLQVSTKDMDDTNPYGFVKIDDLLISTVIGNVYENTELLDIKDEYIQEKK